MNKNWMKVFLASFFEVFWVIGLKHATDIWQWAGTVIAMVLSFYLMFLASQKLPVGTVYAVFVGMGTVGTILAEILFFGEPLKVEKVLLILLLLTGIIGLKFVTQENHEGDRS